MKIEAGTIGIRVRCAAHNHVFEIYTSYTHNGEVVIDLVPCPQCRDHMDNEILPLKPSFMQDLFKVVQKNEALCQYCEGARCCEYRDGTAKCVSCMGTGRKR